MRQIKRTRNQWVLTCVLTAAALTTFGDVARAAGSGQPLIVNIDSPGFRKLVVATPMFRTPQGAAPELNATGKDAATELSRLLTFTGMFSVIGEESYREVVAKMNASNPFGSKTGTDGVDVLQWKGIGIESLTLGEISQEPDGLVISIRTVDINKSSLVLGKKYSKVTKQDVPRVIRRYADLLLQAYTGKPGIFSTMLVFVGKTSPKADKQIFVSDFDGANAHAITKERGPHLSPNWSPDGRFITYTSFEDGNPDLFIFDMQTGKKRKLSGRKGLNSGSSWSPNGRLVALTGTVEGDADIYVMSPSGGERKLLIRGQGLDVDPAFSPDGKWLAFVSGRFGNPHIFRATLEWKSDTEVKVTEDKRLTYAGWYNATPAWAPQSDKIVFAGYDKDIDRFDLFMMNPDGTGMERLTIRAGDNESPTWSPNGQLIIFHSNRIKGMDKKGPAQIWVMNRDGSSQRTLSTGVFDSQTPRWGPILADMTLSQSYQVLDKFPKAYAAAVIPRPAGSSGISQGFPTASRPGNDRGAVAGSGRGAVAGNDRGGAARVLIPKLGSRVPPKSGPPPQQSRR